MITARQVKDLIRNLSKKTGVDSQILIRQYMMDHLLEKISQTRYRDHFILKGGMLITALVGATLRSTLDMDATIQGIPLETSSLQQMFDEILVIEIDDGIRYQINDIENIHEESDYNGYRLSLTAFLDESRIPLKIDITTGDRITPMEIEFAYPMLLEKRSIQIFSYNLETVLAEKLETILSRSIANTRMRDFYEMILADHSSCDVVVTKVSTLSQKIALFRSLFQGREDVYALRYEGKRGGKPGYTPACKNIWKYGICPKPKVRCQDCNYKDYLSIDDQVVEGHLRGEKVIGVYPILTDDRCWFIAIDFDDACCFP